MPGEAPEKRKRLRHGIHLVPEAERDIWACDAEGDNCMAEAIFMVAECFESADGPEYEDHEQRGMCYEHAQLWAAGCADCTMKIQTCRPIENIPPVNNEPC